VWNPSNAELFEEGQFQEKAYKASQTKGGMLQYQGLMVPLPSQGGMLE